MLKLLVTCFNRRSLTHWLPLVRFVREAGGECDFLFFPRLVDPDSRGLFDADLAAHTVLTAPIGPDFTFVDADTDIRRQVIEACLARHYDAVLLGTCVGGPELTLRAWVKSLRPELRFIGLQHGFVQTWSYYEELSKSFDEFAVFGTAFATRMAPQYWSRIITASLPQLDEAAIHREGGRGVLFALQLDMPCDEVKRVALDIQVSSGQQVVLRAHPEHLRLYDTLRDEFAFSEQTESADEALSKADAVVTSGSTVAIQALAAGIPTAVIDHLRGSEYAEFGIVADGSSGARIARILDEQRDGARRDDIRRLVSRYTGRPGTRVTTAYSALLRALRPAGWREELMRINREVLMTRGHDAPV
jgi:hypothetical protein